MKIKADYSYSTEGVMSSSCEFTLSDDILKRIKEGKELLEKSNGVIDYVGLSCHIDTIQFDSTIDDEDMTEMYRDDICYFRHDVEQITIRKGGWIFLKCIGKWDSSQCFEVELDLDL